MPNSNFGIGQAQTNLNPSVLQQPQVAQQVSQQQQAAPARAHLESLLGANGRSMSDDELLAEIQRNSEEMDATINERLVNMRAKQADVRALMGALDAISAQQNAAGDANRPLNLDAEVAIKNPDGTYVTPAPRLGDVLQQAGITLGPTTKMTPDSIKALRDAITHQADSIKTDNERGQMDIQQMMSRRSQIFQMASNVLASRNETRKSIAQNIR